MVGIDLEALVSIASCVLAIFLFGISAIAYRKERRSRLLFVMSAFFLFAVKGILFAVNELYFENEGLNFEWITLTLDFGILLLFFVGLVKK
jgi:cyanate permease